MTSKKRLRIASWYTLMIGLVSAIAIYVFIPPDIIDPLGDPLQSRHYINQLKIWGGNANVLQDEFVRWFDSLWHGKQLGITIAYISGFLFLLLRFIANPIRLNSPTMHEDSYGSSHADDVLDHPVVPDPQSCPDTEVKGQDEGKNDIA
jgi:hypothetical protein